MQDGIEAIAGLAQRRRSSFEQQLSICPPYRWRRRLPSWPPPLAPGCSSPAVGVAPSPWWLSRPGLMRSTSSHSSPLRLTPVAARAPALPIPPASPARVCGTPVAVQELVGVARSWAVVATPRHRSAHRPYSWRWAGRRSQRGSSAAQLPADSCNQRTVLRRHRATVGRESKTKPVLRWQSRSHFRD